MVATSEDVARAAGVSRSAVSQILNGRGQRFATTTRERVEQLARELGYEPSIAGRTLANGASDIVIALIPHTTFSANFQYLYEHTTQELAARGLTLMLRMSPPDSDSLGRLLAAVRPRAVISFTSFSPSELALLDARGVVAVDPGAVPGSDGPNRFIGNMQATHLVDRGYRRLAFAHLHDARQDVFGTEREEGVREVARERGLAEPASLRLDIDREQALAALDSLGPGEYGIVCYNDEVATALLAAAAIRGRAVPEELGVVGMDDIPLAPLTHPPLTTVRVDLASAAHSAVASVIRGLGLEPAAAGFEQPSITLVERESVRS